MVNILINNKGKEVTLGDGEEILRVKEILPLLQSFPKPVQLKVLKLLSPYVITNKEKREEN